MAHGSTLFEKHFEGASTNPPAPILPTLATRPLLPIRPPILEEDSGDGYRTGEGGGSPWENFAEWSNLGQEKQQQVINQLEGVMKWAPRVGTAASLLPFPLSLAGGIGTFMGQGAAQDLYGIQHGDTSDWYKPQWSLWDAFNPLGGATSAEQLSQNIANFESSVLADPDRPEGATTTGWSGRGIPDDIQIEYGGSRSDPEIENLINKAHNEARRSLHKAQTRSPDPLLDEALAADALGAAEEGYMDPSDYGYEFNTGGPVIKRRGFRETATSPLAAGSFVDSPLYDRAVDTSPTYRRW
jgi:hypothetical protein